MKTKTPYWYMSTTWMCPLCGQERTYRSREYTPRPDDWNKRNELKETYDYCDV